MSKQTKRHPHSEPKIGKFASLRFCPSCGCGTLDRDNYRDEHNQPGGGYPEFVCRICGFGFTVRPSLRWMHATTLFAAERKLRPPKDREGEEVREKR